MQRQKDKRTEEIGQAVKVALRSRGITTKQAAEMLDVKPAGVSVYLSGRPFTPKAAQRWSKVFDLNEEYLLTGEGVPSRYISMMVTPEEKEALIKLRSKKHKLTGRKRDKEVTKSIQIMSDALATIKAAMSLPD